MNQPLHAARLSRLALLLALAAAAGGAGAEELPERFIAVSAAGTVSAAPDLARLSLGVETRGRSASEARERAAQAMSAVLQALVSRGVAEADIQSAWVGLSPVYPPEGGMAVAGYVVSHQLSVKLRDLARAGEAVDAAVAAGGDALRVQGIGFELVQAAQAEERARVAAIEAARAKAESYARLTGLQLTGALRVREGGGALPAPGGELLMARMAAAPTPVQPGEVEVRVEVEVLYGVR